MENNIKNFRKMFGYTQTQLGKKIGVSKNTISDWENGIYDPDLKHIKELLRLFEVNFENLF